MPVISQFCPAGTLIVPTAVSEVEATVALVTLLSVNAIFLCFLCFKNPLEVSHETFKGFSSM
jgi:hypothetical protein